MEQTAPTKSANARQAALYAAAPAVMAPSTTFDRDNAYEERLERRRKIAEKIAELQAPDRERLEQARQAEKNRRNAVQAARKTNRRNKR